MDKKEFINALSLFDSEKKLSIDVVIEVLKEALINAFQTSVIARSRDVGGEKSKPKDKPDDSKSKDKEKEVLARVDINVKKGEIKMFQLKNIVEEATNPNKEISLKDAQEINPQYQVGDTLEIPVDIQSFSRPAAIKVKQVLRQKIKEAEKQMVYDAYIDKKDEIIIGRVDRVEPTYSIIDLGHAKALLKASQSIPGERFEKDQQIKVLITSVEKDSKGAQVLVSRADNVFLKRLFEKEITEIYDGTVEIRAISREPGERSKVAVSTRDENVDAAGACIGLKGMRIQRITNEIANEKIDIVQYYDEPELYIAEALKPAHVYGIILDRNLKAAIAVVPNEELSLAIGKKGQNVRLAVKLTGWKIDIKTIDGAMEEHLVYRPLSDVRRQYEQQAEEIARQESISEAIPEQQPIEVTPEEEIKPVEETIVAPEQEQEEIKVAPEEEKIVPEEPIIAPRPAKQTVFPEMPRVSVVEPTETPTVKEEEKPKGPSKKALKRAKEAEAKLSGQPATTMPIYSKEELEEIARQEEEEARASYDDDDTYDEDDYDEYYDR